jgi:environmental stress-induced protein Ves
MKQYTKEHFKQMPWKNGGGTTLELYRLPAETSQPFQLRISIATVNDHGPFSQFPGVVRSLSILEGEGFLLQFPDHVVELTQNSRPLLFHGDEEVNCRLLTGPVKDFNVMINKNWGSFEIVKISGGISVNEEMIFVYHKEKNELYELSPKEEFMADDQCIVIKIDRSTLS